VNPSNLTLKPPSSSAHRFWSDVVIAGPGECWLWRGRKLPRREGNLSYGKFLHDGKEYLAHRFSYWLKHGQLPKAVLHTCDNPMCVNPRHLRGGTQAMNVADMIAKGRRVVASGPRFSHCKRGHEYTPQNTMAITIKRKPARRCLTCYQQGKRKAA
jgi:hypothetical protein